MNAEEIIVDCDEGRRLGCATFCCRLVVRYAPDEVVLDGEGRRKGCVDKDLASGLCAHIDRATHRCRAWDARPRVCRAYDCNHDPLLQIVLRDGFRSLVTLVRTPAPPRETWVRVPSRARRPT